MLIVSGGIMRHYMVALRAVSANTAGTFLNLAPLFGFAGAFVFLGERLFMLQFLGIMVTVAAVTMIGFGGRQTVKEG
ncbi:EamA family transporter [Varunaivibrio sulfuroxidans]|nr:EamA family transporter [Varunaivibrio sulfuroxidans]